MTVSAVITLPDGRKAKLTGPDRDALIAKGKEYVASLKQEFPEVPTLPEAPGQTGPAPQQPGFIEKAMLAAKSSDLATSPIDTLNKLRTSIGVGGLEGLTRFATGAGQSVSNLGEMTGLLPEGYSERVKEGGQTLLTQMGEMGQNSFEPIRTGTRVATEMLPFLKVKLPGGGLLKDSLGAAKIGGVAGYTAPTENTGKEGVQEAVTKGGLSALLGATVPPALALGGKVLQYVTPLGARRLATMGANPEEVRKASQIAREQGIFTDPAAAPSEFNPGQVQAREALSTRREMRFVGQKIREEMRRKLDMSDPNARKLVNSLYKDILPEGSPSEARQMVDNLYTEFRNSGAKVSEAQFQSLLDDEIVGRVVNDISRSPIASKELAQYEVGSAGQLDAIRQGIRGEISRLEKALLSENANKSVVQAELKAASTAKEKVVDLMRSLDPRIDQALSLSQREQIIREMASEFGYSKKFTDEIVGISPFEQWKKFFSTSEKFNKLSNSLRSITDVERRDAALKKADLVKDIMNRYVTTKKTYDKAIENIASDLQERSQPFQTAFYTILHSLRRSSNRAIMNYLLDEQMSPKMAEKALSAKTPEEFMFEFGRILSVASARELSGNALEEQVGKNERQAPIQ